MRKIFGKSARISGILTVALLLASCGNQPENASENITTEIATEAATEAPDTTSPVIELASDGVAYYEGDKYDPMEYVISVTDDSGETIKAEYDDKDVNIASPGDYVISYSATDSAGNSSEKKLNLKVKKEYTRDEIKEIIQKLIDEKYYIFETDDEQEHDESEFDEGAYTGGIFVWGVFDDQISDVPTLGIWPSDTQVYTIVNLSVFLDDKNHGYKNANTDTMNSELLVNIKTYSGEGKMSNATSVDISSDNGKMKIETILENGAYIFDKPNYFKASGTLLCFRSEEEIDEFKKILNANNVNIKVHFQEGDDFVYTFNQNQRNNWLRTINFYDDINDYVNNIPAN